MGIIERMGWIRPWRTNLNQGTADSITANYLVCGIIFLFVGIFFLFAILGSLLIDWFVIDVIFVKFFPNLEVDRWVWMVYGIIFGVSFSFFVQALPARTNPNETPEKIWQSFRHHFSYFLVFFSAVLFYILIIGCIALGFIGLKSIF